MVEPPLGEPAFLILTALAATPQHGYGVIEDVVRISEGRVRLHAGTLYAVLDRLRTGGLIEVEREEIVQSRLRRYYRLTGLGARRLTEETERMRRHVEVAGRRLRKLGAATQPATTQPATPRPTIPRSMAPRPLAPRSMAPRPGAA